MNTPNQDLWKEARMNVAAVNNPAHWRAICERHQWDCGTLVQAEVRRLLKAPPLSEGTEA